MDKNEYFSKISVLLHRESIVHGMVEFNDGSYKALLSYPDMHMPIQHVLLLSILLVI